MVPGGAAGHYLLGRICRLSGRHKEAETHFAAALTLDPLLWCAFEELCMLGEPQNTYCNEPQTWATYNQIFQVLIVPFRLLVRPQRPKRFLGGPSPNLS